MSIKRLPSGKYRLDFRPDGKKGKRIIKLFDLKTDAVQFRNKTLSGRLDNLGSIAPLDNRRLHDLIDLWFEYHGRSLKSSVDTKNRLFKLSDFLNNPVAKNLSSVDFVFYRKTRLSSGLNESTLNRELITLKAMFRELKRMAVIDYDSDIITVRKLRETKTELSYLTTEQIHSLIYNVQQTTNSSLLYVVLTCLATGARWSEAERLKPIHCLNGGFHFVDTKNGLSRFVPVNDDLFELIKNILLLSPVMALSGRHLIVVALLCLKVSLLIFSAIPLPVILL